MKKKPFSLNNYRILHVLHKLNVSLKSKKSNLFANGAQTKKREKRALSGERKLEAIKEHN